MMDLFAILNSLMVYFLIVECIRVIIFTPDWKLRTRPEGESLKHWQKVLVLMFFFLVIFPVLNWFFLNYLTIFFVWIGMYQISFFFILMPLVYLWVEKRILSYPWRWSDLIPGGIILLDVIITIWI
ncbi:MAG: hypothetical protein NUV97_00820 [archaeon]|nr:hypothetical protein [archaeon]MCR4323372.1 hypothetical protein [Nanoarchaeota archaeon]